MKVRALLIVLSATLLMAASSNDTKKAFPTSGAQHPFAKAAPTVNVDQASKGISKPGLQQLKVEQEAGFPFEARVPYNSSTILVRLEATSAVPKVALQYLTAQMRASDVDLQKRKDIEPFLRQRSTLLKGQMEVRLPVVRGPKGRQLMLSWPDGWDMVRPNVLRLRETYRQVAKYGTPAPRSSGDVGVSTAALTGSWSRVQGVLQCRVPDPDEDRPLKFAAVELNGIRTTTDASGAFTVSGSFTNVDRLTVTYDGRVPPPAGVATGPRVSVMNDFHNPRSENVDIPRGTTSAGVLDTGTLTLTSLDCELFETGARTLEEHARTIGIDPPSPDDLRIKRWEDVFDGTHYAYYDYVVISKGFRRDYRSSLARQDTLQHEFGHTLRHAADGDAGHWGWDNFRWAYARTHSGNEVFNEHYAFNEGWAQYWECTFAGRETACPLITTDNPGVRFLDWNELQIGARLLVMGRMRGVGHRAMLNILINNPGSIHTLYEFEQKYCQAFPNTPFICNRSDPLRRKADCPPGFTNDGTTCRLNNILAKPSYGRGVGTIPAGCSSGEYDVGLCRRPCPPGFDGVGPVCWRRCPAGMNDDGAFCRRDVQIISSNNSACPWYDVCGLTFARGCSTCPPGFQNDGCTCRIDAWIFAKESHGRGVGDLPTSCGAGQEYDAGLCYPVCRSGFNGVGPVCWGSCPRGFADHGATCYRDPNVLVRF